MMNRFARNGMWLVLIGFLLVLFASSYAFAQDQQFYVALKPGAFIPQGDIDEWDTGFSGDLAFAKRYSKNLAVEMNVGWYNLDEGDRVSGVYNGVPYSVDGSVDMDIFPFALTVKGILPFDRFELYGLAGLGAYYTRAEAKASVTVGNLFLSGSENDSDWAAGFTIGLGATYNISSSWFVGAEGKYLFTSDVTLYGVDTNLNGIIVTGVIGYRF